MKIVIDISKSLYKAALNGLATNEIWGLRITIANGTLIPKGHGRIIDESKITQTTYETIEEEFESLLHGTIKRRYVVFKGSDAPTIIEADKESGKEE